MTENQHHYHSELNTRKKRSVSTSLRLHGNKVLLSGLFICPEFSFLGVSPDGIVEDISTGDRGLLEVKCFYSATQKGIKERKCAYTPQEAAVFLKDCPIKKSTTGHLMLGKNEGHHSQVQGAMQIAKAGWCDYVAWTPNRNLHSKDPKRRQLLDRKDAAEFEMVFLQLLAARTCITKTFEGGFDQRT